MKTYIKTGLVIIGVLVLFGILFSMMSKATYDEPNLPRPTLGNPSASVVIEEFSDLQCPACAQSQPLVKQILMKYRDSVYFKFKHFPLRSIHFNAYNAAQAAECAHDQGVFFPFVDAAYQNQYNLNKGGLVDIAKRLELNMDLFKTCLDSSIKSFMVDKDLSEGNARKIAGTPTFFVNGVLIEGGVEELEAEIMRQLNQQ